MASRSRWWSISKSAGTARQLAKYESLTAMIDSIVGGVPHKVAVVGYDSSPVLAQDFIADSDTATKAI